MKNKLISLYREKTFLWMKVLGIFLFFFLSIGIINASDINDSQILFEDNRNSGYITFKVPVYDDNNYDEWLYYSGSTIKIKVDGTSYTCIEFGTKEQKEADWYWADIQVIKGHHAEGNNTRGSKGWKDISSSSRTRIEANKSGSTTIIEIRYYIPGNWLGKELHAEVYLTVDGNMGAGGYKVTKSQTFSSNQNYTFPSVEAALSMSNPGYYTLTGTVSSTVGSTNRYYGEGSTASKEFSGNSFSYDVSIQDTDRNVTTSVRYKVSDAGGSEQSITKSAPTSVKGYPLPKDMTAKQETGGKVKLTWNMKTSGDQGGYFEIQRSDNSNFNNPVILISNLAIGSSESKSYTDDVSELNLNGTYYYRVRRTNNNWQWAKYSSTSIDISMEHRAVVKTSAILNGSKATIAWELADSINGIWSKNSKIYINRVNVTAGGSKELIEVPKDSLSISQNQGRYTDDLFIMCNKYRYEVFVQPGSAAYQKADPMYTESVTPIEMGALKTLNASLGYFSDRIELEWTSDGNTINEFIVLRKEHGSGNDFKQIGKIEGSKASSYYKYDDIYSLPGIIYDYQVTGLIRCADEVLYSIPLETTGFRTPTGDIYGRITFSDGQAVENVEINVTTTETIPGKSLKFNAAGDSAIVSNPEFLKTVTDSITIQAWVHVNNGSSSGQKIISKPGMYELGIDNEKFYFKVGNQILSTNLTVAEAQLSRDFVHLTGVYTGNKLLIYVNAVLVSEKSLNVALTGTSDLLQFGGGNFTGIIDEVRIWNSILTADVIKRDYSRYLTGGESNLIGYWNFNFATATDFFDLSYKGSNYNANHGKVHTASITSNLAENPSNTLLGYRGVTLADGSYSVRAIPYIGNSTPYQIMPKMGIHTFEPEVEIRNIGPGSQSHTVNFIDKSSFKVSGKVTYSNSIIPVQGVNFYIDGKMALENNGMPKVSAADGKFEISVPVGTHEVKASKAGHVFENEGRIPNQYGQDLNYQDAVTGLDLKDSTLVKYIGRVAGGTVQEAYPIGHSLSKNNLAKGVTVTLTHTMTQTLSFDTSTKTEAHFKPSNKKKAHTNLVEYKENKVTIFPNDTTGEFVAYVIPEVFTVTVKAPGHENIPGSGETLNLTQKFSLNSELYEYSETIPETDKEPSRTENYSDTVHYHASQKFIKRYAPELRIRQINDKGEILNYFGTDSTTINNILGDIDTIPLYLNGQYALGKPVFVQHANYNYKADVFEKYIRYDSNGLTSLGVDEVPTQDAKILFNNEIAANSDKSMQVEVNEKGFVTFSFKAGDPELTSAVRQMAATLTYGNEANATTIPWTYPSNFTNGEAYVIGFLKTGSDFVTEGPDRVLTVLRDPPGSNSYSYLEKGSSFTESSTYTGSVTQSGSEDFTTGVKQKVVTFAGVGAGTITENVDVGTGMTIGIKHEEEYEGQDTETKTTTISQRFQTSDDPLYVGANADVYIGYSTNVSVSTTNNVTFVSKDDYLANGGDYTKVYTDFNKDWILVQHGGLGVSQKYKTLFAYPQIHIEQRLIPELENLRNYKLIAPGLLSESQAYQLAEDNDSVLYLSYFSKDSEHFGKSNTDPSIKNIQNGTANDVFDGPSYKVIYKKGTTKSISDEILHLNQSIQNWINRMADNEKAKAEAELLQNYSFHAGSPIEYSETYSTGISHESSFSIMVGGKIANDFKTTVFGAVVMLAFEENLETRHGGTFSSEEEASHSKGFVLAEEGDDDYISVDVCREKGWKQKQEEYEGSNHGAAVESGDLKEKDYYSSFIFKTQAGVTSCPYEGAYVSKYYEPGTLISVATMQLEKPEIDMPKKFIENVPSGETAKLQLYLRNNSEAQEDVYFDLMVVDAANPNGARFSIDGGAIGNGRAFLVPAGETMVKTLEIGKGAVLNYDNLKLSLQSQCQADPTSFLDVISDTVTFSVHFIPSCTKVNIKKPTDNWTYNTRLSSIVENGVKKHYMDVVIDEFDVNYDNFGWIKLQYKSKSQSDEEWTTLMNYYNDSTLFDSALKNGLNAEMIDPANAGKIPYRFFMDDMSDQRYDLRAVSVCLINNEEIENASEIRSGIKDMYRPRLFGSVQPANGILTINDEIRLNFNEPIAEGLLTDNNFQVRGVRNGSISDHSVSVRFDGISDFMETEFEKNLSGKDITVEMWIQADQLHNATLFSHGNVNESFEVSITADQKLQVKIGSETVTSDAYVYDQGSWAHVAVTYKAATDQLTAYYNFSPIIAGKTVGIGSYNAIGNFLLGKSIAQNGNFYQGKMHNLRIWEKALSEDNIKLNSLAQLSGNEAGLLAYYMMDEGKGTICEDKARGASMLMSGCLWSMPDGYALATNGSNYARISAGSHAVTSEMDYTFEFWFKADEKQVNATMFSNGNGDGTDAGGSKNYFSVGFDQNGSLAFINNAVKTIIEGDYQDNDWHHFSFTVDRTIGRAQIYMDGNLTNYIDASKVGAVSSTYMFLGARGWYTESAPQALKVDNYFKGAFDDLRFWELYRSERIVSENNNVKLSGEELGLVHYYPFDMYIEYQGIKYLEFTKNDMRIASGPNPETDSFVIVGSTEELAKSKDIAPLKDFGPVSDLEFDFVVNNDALIINLKEPEYKVAKTIITFTVDDVRDVNGNSIASPIIWSAYIDRNQVKWSEEEIKLEKSVYDEMEFTVRAVNNGGSIQRYTINNIPSWLDVTPSSGSLSPSSSEEIVFVVDEGLNVGNYNEVIYLTNEDNVSEALNLTLVVKGEKPNWSVDPSQYKYNMNVFGKMRFNNIFSSDKGDMLAAFDTKGNCIGVSTSTYNKAFDMWYAMLTVYSNAKQGEAVEFRMWDASTGKTYKAIPDTEITFKNDGIYGDVDNPIIFDGKEIFYQNMSLTKGWNWISFNLADENLSSTNNTLAMGTWTSADVIKSKDNFDSYSTSKGWKGSLSNKEKGLNNTKMYMLHTSQAQVLSISGTALNTKENPISVKGQQWNYIGYLPSVNTTAKEALAGYDAQKGDILKSQNTFAMFSRNEWVGNLKYMEANKGYMLYRSADGDVTFTYPSVSASLSNVQRSKVAVDNMFEQEYVNSDFSDNMLVVATTDNLNEQDRIHAYINGELRGIGTYVAHDGNAMNFITVSGDESNVPVRFDLERNGKFVASTYSNVKYLSNSIQGNIENPVHLDFGSREDNVIVYPNPFIDQLNVSVNAKIGSEIEITVSDVLGRIIMIQGKQKASAPVNIITLNASAFETGLYIIQVTVDGVKTSYKAEKQ